MTGLQCTNIYLVIWIQLCTIHQHLALPAMVFELSYISCVTDLGPINHFWFLAPFAIDLTMYVLVQYSSWPMDFVLHFNASFSTLLPVCIAVYCVLVSQFMYFMHIYIYIYIYIYKSCLIGAITLSKFMIASPESCPKNRLEMKWLSLTKLCLKLSFMFCRYFEMQRTVVDQ